MSTVHTDQRIPLDAISVDGNVRDLDLAHVDNLAASIALRGLIVPIAVCPEGDDRYGLVAGFHRYAACLKLGWDDVPVTVREEEGSTADRAAENVVRKQLTPLEEARAVQAMLDEGYTLDGSASVLGWSRQLVGQRVKILELPELAQKLIGSREIPVGAVDSLLRINAVALALVEAVATAVRDEIVPGSQLQGNLGWALGQAMRHTETKQFAVYLDQVNMRDVESLKLGKKVDAALEEAEKLHKQLDQYAYGPRTIRFTEADVDQARAAGVLIELEATAPIICDRALYRELCKQAIHRTVDELRDRKSTRAEEQAELKATRADREPTEKERLDNEHRAALRDFAARAHNVNLDLGAALTSQLCVVDPDSVDVARFFAYGLLGPDRPNHLGVGENVARVLAANGLRLVLDDLRITETPTLKSGKPGKTKVTYAETDDAQARLWKYVEAGKTAGEIYGRALVVIAAQHYAFQIALPTSQRRNSILPGSRRDSARKALERLTKPILPGTHKELTRAIEREARDYGEAVEKQSGRGDAATE